MIARIRDRRAFERLARDGERIRRPALWCTCCPVPSSSTTSVAFAISRALGPAVTRNRLRRRLRALLRAADQADPLPKCLLLIGARPKVNELTFDQLRVEVDHILVDVRRVCKA